MEGNGTNLNGTEFLIRYRRGRGRERLYIDTSTGAGLGFYDCGLQELHLTDLTRFEAVATALFRFLVQ
jgi:hypothetical protein